MAVISPTGAAAPVSLRATGAARRRLHVERAVKAVLGLAAACTIGITALIVVSLVGPSVEFFREVSFGEFFGGDPWAPLFNPPRFGVWPIVVGTPGRGSSGLTPESSSVQCTSRTGAVVKGLNGCRVASPGKGLSVYHLSVAWL